MKSLLKYTIIVCLFTLPFLALYVAGGSFFPFITGKNFLFRALVEIAFFAWIPLMLRFREFRPKKNIVLWGFAGFVLTMAVSTMMAVNPEKAFWSNFERMEGYITILHLFALFLVASTVMKTPKIWGHFWDTSIIAGVLIACVGFARTTDWVRIDGTLGNATYFAVSMLFCLFFVFYMVIRRIREGYFHSLWWFYGPSTIILLIGLYYAGTRGTILGFIGGIGLITLVISFAEKKALLIKKLARITLVCVVALVLGFVAIKDTSFVHNSSVLNRFSSISTQDGTAKARLMVWGEALQGVKEKPIFGWGQENFNYVFNKYYDPGMYAQEQWFDRTHNVILDWLVTGGILGLIGYLFLYGSSFWFLWKGKAPYNQVVSKHTLAEPFTIEKSVIAGLFVAYFIHNLFVFDNIMSWVPFIMVVSFISSLWAPGEVVADSSETEISDSTLRSIVIPVSIVALVWVGYFSVWKGSVAASSLVDALRYGQDLQNEKGEVVQPANIRKTIDTLKSVIALNTFANSEARERIVEMVPTVQSRGTMNERVEFMQFAQDQFTKQLAETPLDARYQMFAGSLASNYGSYADAEKFYLRALELSPHKQSLLYQLAQVYLRDKKNDEALDAFKEAYLAYPTNPEAITLYATGLVYVDKVAESDAFITQNKEVLKSQGSDVVTVGDKTYLLDQKILATYVEKNLVDKVDSALRAGIESAKGTDKAVTYYKQLIGVYMKINKNDKASALIEELIKAFPDNKENTLWQQALIELRQAKK